MVTQVLSFLMSGDISLMGKTFANLPVLQSAMTLFGRNKSQETVKMHAAHDPL